MKMSAKVAVVTGANKGIGFSIVRGLCKTYDGIVLLTARNEGRGLEAVKKLENEGLKPIYAQLDITDPKSVTKFRDHVKSKYGGIDILINNAAIAFKRNAAEPPGVQAEETLFVNYFSLVSTCEILFPIIRDGRKVIHMSSSCGHLSLIPSTKLREKLKNPKLTVEALSELMREYVEEAKKGTHVEEWGNSSYKVSKVGVSALTFIQQRELEGRNIKVNCCHPGYVDTDMTSHEGVLHVDQGAVSALFLALETDEIYKGKYVWHDKTIVDWDGEKPAKY